MIAEAEVSKDPTEELSNRSECVNNSAAIHPRDQISMRSSKSIPNMISGAL